MTGSDSIAFGRNPTAVDHGRQEAAAYDSYVANVCMGVGLAVGGVGYKYKQKWLMGVGAAIFSIGVGIRFISASRVSDSLQRSPSD